MYAAVIYIFVAVRLKAFIKTYRMKTHVVDTNKKVRNVCKHTACRA